MALKNSWKEKLDEVIGFAKDKASNVANTIRNVVRQPTQNTNSNKESSFQKFQQNFNEGYKKFTSQQQEIAKQKQQDFNDYTNQFLNSVRSPETKQKFYDFADKTAQAASPTYKAGRVALKTAQNVNSVIPGGFKGGFDRVGRVIKEDPGSLWIGRGFAEAPENAKTVLSPIVGEQIAENIGYGVRGAANLTGMNWLNKSGIGGEKTRQLNEENSPQTQRQQTAQDIGQAIGGTIMTAPGAGGALGMLKNAGLGTTLGLAMTTVDSLTNNGRLPTKDELVAGGVEGLENSWQLAIANTATDKLLTKIPFLRNLTTPQVENIYKLLGNASEMGVSGSVKKKLLGKVLQTTFFRSLAEVPAQDAVLSFVHQLDDKAKEGFFQEWLNNLPGMTIGNVVFGVATGGVRGLADFHKADLAAGTEALQKAYQKFATDQTGAVSLGGSVDELLAKNGQVKAAQQAFNAGNQKKVNELAKQFPDDKRITSLAEIINKEMGEPAITAPQDIQPETMVEPKANIDDPALKAIQEDLKKSIDEQMIADLNAKNNPVAPDTTTQSDYEIEAQKKLFGQDTVEQTNKTINENGSVLKSLEDDFDKNRELRNKRWDIPTIIGNIKTQWTDKYHYAEQYDPELYLNMRLFGGGGDTRVSTVIEKNLGPILKNEADAGRAKDFANLLALDRLNELVDRGLTRHLNKAEIQRGYAELQSKYTPEEISDMQADAQKFRGFLANLLDAAEKSGLVSAEAAQAARNNNEFYVTLETTGQMERKYQDQNWLDSNQGRKSNSFNVSKQEVLRKIGDSDTGIADPTESSLGYAVNTIQNIERNSILRNFTDRRAAVPKGDGWISPDGTKAVAIPLRQAQNVRERIRINSEIGELQPVQRKLQRLISTRGGWVKQLQNELNKLNIQGIDINLKPEDDLNINQGRLGRVLEGKVAKLNELDAELDNLNLQGLDISLQQEPNIVAPKEYFRKTGGKFDSGADQYTKATVYPRIKSVVEQMVIMPDSQLKSIQNKIAAREAQINGEEVFITENGQKRTGYVSGLVDEILDIKDQLRMQKFVDSLISLPPEEMAMIKRKIGTREGKVNDIMNEISQLSDNLESVKDDLVQLRTERGEIKDLQEAPEGYGTINVFRDGIKEEWAVPKELEIAIKNLDAQQSGTVIEWYNKWINQPFKQAVTSKNPAFVLLVNPTKDVQNALFAESTEKGFQEAAGLMQNYIGAVGDSFGLSQQRQNWLLTGGGSSGFLSSELKVDPTTAIKDLQSKGTLTDRFEHTIKNPLKLLDYIGRSTEESTRLAKFNKDFEKLSPEIKAVLENPYIPLAELPIELRQIALESRNITQDFARMGTAAQQVNKIISFFNPTLQGSIRFVNLAKDNPGRFIATAGVMTGVPALITYLNNRNFEDYKDLRDYERRGNLIWIYKDRTPEEVEAKAPLHAFKVPLGQLGAPFYNVTEELLKFTDDSEPGSVDRLAEAMGDVGKATLGNMSPGSDISSIMPLPLKVGAQLKTNTDLYSGMPIEPDYVDTDGDGIGDTPKNDVPDAYRTGYYTGPTTALLGRITGPTLGLSPAELDNIISSTTGGSGKTIVGGIDTLLGDAPETKSNPLLNRFMAPRAGQIQQNEYDEEAKINKQIQDETFGKGINFNGLGLAESADASTDTALIKGDGKERPLPETTKELGVLYEDAEKTLKSYEEKKTKIQYGEYASETKRNKELKALEAEYQSATSLKNDIETRYPKQVYEIGLTVYGKGSEQGVEKRADWAVEQFQKAQTPEEFQKMVNEMWESGVLTGKSNGVAAYIKDVYGVDVPKYTGDDPTTKKAAGGGSGSGKKLGKLSVSIPKINYPDIKLGSSEYGKGISQLLKPLNLKSGYSQIKLKVPKPDVLKLPTRKKISAEISPMRTRIRGL